MADRHTYRDLEIWQLGMELTEQVYRITNKFPQSEMYGLASQLRRAAVSIPANIAEGYGRSSDNNLSNFVRIARGSLAEVETLVELSIRIGFVSEHDAEPITALFGAIGRKTYMFLRAIDPKSVREAVVEYDPSRDNSSESVMRESVKHESAKQ